MGRKEEKARKLAQIARMYYIDDYKQSDIAKAVGVSRPFVSRMLQEARDLKIVEIIINEPEASKEQILAKLSQAYGIKGVVTVEEGQNAGETNRLLARGAIELLPSLKTKRLGLGWGHLIGEMVSYLEQAETVDARVLSVCPLIGNAGVPIRHYQSSESVRVFAEKLGATPHFLNLPALPGDYAEKEILRCTESYRQISRQWGAIDTAFVNIGNYPTTPDFASGARYGTLLQQKKACGCVVAYFLNETGEIISSEQDFAMQIPIETLRRCKNVVGLCSANVAAPALRGALGTKLFTHLVVRQGLINEVL